MTKSNGDLAEIKTEIRYISKSIDEIKETLKDMNKLTDEHSTKISALETRSSLIAGALSVFTIIASSIAAWLGMRGE